MAIFEIDDKNELYYEYVPPKNGGFTCVFVNALTGDLSAWYGSIGENLIKNNDGYLVYQFLKKTLLLLFFCNFYF